jgi:hypothetical protein
MKYWLIALALALSGCVNYGQTVMVSKGRAGAVQAVFGADAEFCKLTSSEGVTITDADRAAFVAFCDGE